MPDTKPLLNTQPSQTRFNMGRNMEDQKKKKKVLVVGAGAAGMCPYTQILYPSPCPLHPHTSSAD